MKLHVRRGHFLMVGLLLALILGCNISAPPTETTVIATPTINSLFSRNSEEIMNSNSDQLLRVAPEEDEATNTPVPTPRPSVTPTAIPTQAPTPTAVPPITIFDESLHPDWELSYSTMRYDEAYSDMAYSGRYSMALIPTTPFREFYVTVREDAGAPYLRDDIVAVTFQLYSGSDWVSTTDLAMTIVGSNEAPYFQPDDDSVTNIYDPIFSETELTFMGVTNDIPPDTWVWVTNYLDDREYDPDFEYITGIYIKNDEGFTRTVLIDDLQFIPLADERRSP